MIRCGDAHFLSSENSHLSVGSKSPLSLEDCIQDIGEVLIVIRNVPPVPFILQFVGELLIGTSLIDEFVVFK